MNDLKTLISQRDQLDAEIETTRKIERSEALPKVRALIAEYGMTESEVFGTKNRGRNATGRPIVRRSSRPGQGVAKYKDPNSEKTWSGLGRPPEWAKNVDLDGLQILG